MNRIVVIGSCNMDIVVLADKRPAAGETIMGNELHIAHGGKGANQAVAAARPRCRGYYGWLHRRRCIRPNDYG